MWCLSRLYIVYLLFVITVIHGPAHRSCAYASEEISQWICPCMFTSVEVVL